MLRNSLEQPMSFKQVQEFLGCGKTFLYEELQSGRLAGYKLGRKWIIYPSDLQRYLRQRPSNIRKIKRVV